VAERGRPLYCAQCGSNLYPEYNFCEVCGARVPPNTPDAAPTQDMPPQVHAPPGVSAGNRKLGMIMLIGTGVVLVLALAIGSVAALILLRNESNPLKPHDRKEAAAGASDSTAPKPVGADSDAQKKTQQPSSEETPRSAPGYNLVQTTDGSLTAEIPLSWRVETGENSEKDAGPNTWSYVVGDYLPSSITTAPNLDAWYSTGTSGAYLVASRALAQDYTDYELTHSLLNAGKNNTCTPGTYKDLDHSAYSGKIQTWYGCGVDEATVFSVAAAPKSRECVVVLNARVSDEADREAIEHLNDTFKVDCGHVTSRPLATPSSSASPSGSPQSYASAQ
jgi:hypothetical protein